MSSQLQTVKPVVLPPKPLYKRLSYGIQTYLFQLVSKVGFNLFLYFASARHNKYTPVFVKTFSIRPSLQCRIFIPSTHQQDVRHSIYIDIHGGGFFAGTAMIDDKFCYTMCNKLNIVVVSLSYRLAPQHPYPTAIDDCTELILAVLSDTSLPIRTDHFAIGGQSAGATLALSVAQDPRLRDRIAALVAFYPATDFSYKFSGPFRDRPKADGSVERDGLRPIFPLAGWAYVPHGQDRADPRLSPVYAKREDLPERIYFVAAQYDVLAKEAFEMAKGLTNNQNLREEECWEQNGVRWECMPGETHGCIEEGWAGEFLKAERQPFKPETAAMLDRVGQWLMHSFDTQ